MNGAMDEHEAAAAWAELLVPQLRMVVAEGEVRGLPLPILVSAIYEVGAQLAREIGYTPDQVVELLETQIDAVMAEDEDEPD
ncbi:hypothetical protein [Arenibaculum pallidiluteum]|uniref:hypothetical protein n=1 Tax=Arenibaculum pallidiluteum TaxID=2812559 RepID=UPI001A963A01|nr:hypothetical protein [Arenibaculum pallidiluteum]